MTRESWNLIGRLDDLETADATLNTRLGGVLQLLDGAIAQIADLKTQVAALQAQGHPLTPHPGPYAITLRFGQPSEALPSKES